MICNVVADLKICRAFVILVGKNRWVSGMRWNGDKKFI